jgi:hypothetical protein
LEECDKDVGDNERSIEGKFVRRIFMPAPEDVHILPFEEVGVNQQREQVAAASPPRKKSRLSYGRKPHNESHWWLEHLTSAIRKQYLADPHGRLSLKFRRLFRVPFDMFLDLVEMAN